MSLGPFVGNDLEEHLAFLSGPQMRGTGTRQLWPIRDGKNTGQEIFVLGKTVALIEGHSVYLTVT